MRYECCPPHRAGSCGSGGASGATQSPLHTPVGRSSSSAPLLLESPLILGQNRLQPKSERLKVKSVCWAGSESWRYTYQDMRQRLDPQQELESVVEPGAFLGTRRINEPVASNHATGSRRITCTAPIMSRSPPLPPMSCVRCSSSFCNALVASVNCLALRSFSFTARIAELDWRINGGHQPRGIGAFAARG